jgi:hypothetical protein
MGIDPFRLRPAAEARWIALVVEGFVVLVIFGSIAAVWSDLARLM